MTKVIKRDGSLVDFDREKIINAIVKAGHKYNENLLSIVDNVVNNLPNNTITVDDIQKEVEKQLILAKEVDVARDYITYRYIHDVARNKYKELLEVIDDKLFARGVENQNANVDERSFGGRKGEMANAILKDYALNYCMSDMAKNNHLNNEIYIHDLDSYSLGLHNCLSLPVDDLLKNGFNTRQVDIRPCNSVSTAFQLLAVMFQIQSLQMFGGVAATHLDWSLVPYVRKSFNKHYRNGLKYIEDREDLIDKYTSNSIEYISIEDDWYKENSRAYKYAIDMVTKEIQQAVEGMYHNLNSLQSRSGNQLPFSSINYGTCTLVEGRLIIKALLDGSIKGVGALHKTSVFPCGIFQIMEGVNKHKGDPNYDLFRLALESTSKRLYPNYCNVDWSVNSGYDKHDPRTFNATMG